MSRQAHIEDLAQDIFRHVPLCEHHARVVSQHPQGQQACHRVLRDWHLLAKEGGALGTTGQRAAKMSWSKSARRKRQLWTSSHVKIVHAAQAMVKTIILYDMRQLSESERDQVNVRAAQLHQQSLPPPDPIHIMASRPFRAVPLQPAHPLALGAVVTGKRFSLQYDESEEPVSYTIRGVNMGPDDNYLYKIKFDDDVEEEIDAEEMLELLTHSQLAAA
ncbi:hypothetical protein BOTBODRAFT_187226 [Botryobasidium botryosum FD-172 SS1]|uniref:Uncharacterized protein n=1 Tax=Botryobasidium botryosum (strain FD-172 SS1) TaxID=930990 RepID=A0A067MU66_BOTB1|nr:hypothetical protein BOTBODRAFT_187226 [Botryobasidium botryosum FD-172 SS1]